MSGSASAIIDGPETEGSGDIFIGGRTYDVQWCGPTRYPPQLTRSARC